jgi:hypothetical protein
MRLRTLAWILAFTCGAFAVQAQEQEAVTTGKLLQTRNTDVAPALYQNKAFTDGSSYGGLRDAHVKSFYLRDGFTTKEYATNPYTTRNFWSGYFKFDTKQANLSDRGTFAQASKQFETKAAETRTAMESGKEYATRTYATRDFRGKEARGKDQDRLDREGPAALAGPNALSREDSMHVLTIDEVRELLNKSK